MDFIETCDETFKKTILAYRSARQAGLSHLDSHYAAERVHEKLTGGDSDSSKAVVSIISTASQRAPEWLWEGVGGKGNQTPIHYPK